MSELTIHTKTNVSAVLKALADVAGKIADLKIEMGDKRETERLENEVLALAVRLFSAGMAVTTSVEELVDPSKPQADKPAKKAKAAKPKAVKTKAAKPTVTDDALALPAADKKSRKGYAVQGTCVICGKAYLKRSPVQKTCSPECQAAKNKAYAQERRAETAGGSGGDRLTRIKDIADKLA